MELAHTTPAIVCSISLRARRARLHGGAPGVTHRVGRCDGYLPLRCVRWHERRPPGEGSTTSSFGRWTEEPNLPAQTFHAILCRWGLMFLPQPGPPSTDCGACYAQEGGLWPPPGARRRWEETDAERNHMCGGTEQEPIKQGQ